MEEEKEELFTRGFKSEMTHSEPSWRSAAKLQGKERRPETASRRRQKKTNGRRQNARWRQWREIAKFATEIDSEAALCSPFSLQNENGAWLGCSRERKEKRQSLEPTVDCHKRKNVKERSQRF